MSGELDPWREYADACCEHDCEHGRRALAEMIPLPRYEECFQRHTRPGGEQVICVREAGHTGRHVGYANSPLRYTWDPVPTALTAAVIDPQPHCLGGHCEHEA